MQSESSERLKRLEKEVGELKAQLQQAAQNNRQLREEVECWRETAHQAAKAGEENFQDCLQLQEESNLKQELLNLSGIYPKNLVASGTQTEAIENSAVAATQTDRCETKHAETQACTVKRTNSASQTEALMLHVQDIRDNLSETIELVLNSVRVEADGPVTFEEYLEEIFTPWGTQAVSQIGARTLVVLRDSLETHFPKLGSDGGRARCEMQYKGITLRMQKGLCDDCQIWAQHLKEIILERPDSFWIPNGRPT
jgi:regulator of replication initiation timing